jgi:hypothetical protein
MTRYEMAVLINRAVDKMEAQIAAGQKQNAADIATLKKLVDAFGAELKAVQDHVAALDTKVAAIDAAERADATLLKRQQFHLYTFLRAPGSYQDSVSAFNGPAASSTTNGMAINAPAGGAIVQGTRLVNNDSLGSPGGVAGQNASYTGSETYGTAYMVNRLLFTGDIDPNVSYIFRLENRYYMETPNYGAPAATIGNSGSAPFYCTSLSPQAAPLVAGATTCPLGSDYPSNETFRLNIAQLTWHTPGGFYVQGGRLVQGDGGSDLGGQPVNLAYSDYFNGGLIGYAPTSGPLATLRIEAGYGVGQPSLQGNATHITQQQMWGQVSYDIMPKHLNIGAAWVSEIGNSETLWDPSAPMVYQASGNGFVKGAPVLSTITGTQVTGAYCGIQLAATLTTTGCPAFHGTNMTFGSVFLTYRMSDYLHVNVEGVHHFGNDPFTGATWSQPNGLWGVVTLGNNAGPKGTPWGDIGYIATGFNGESVEGGITSTTTYFPIYVGNPAGYQIVYGSLHYKIANNADIAIILQRHTILNGTAIPAGSSTCPGCYISGDTKNAIYLQTLFAF